MSSPWLLLQLADSAFPSGGFAHSGGLEAAYQQGLVEGAAALRTFVCAWAWQAGHGSLPLIRSAHEAPTEWAALDARAESFLVSEVARRASRTQGRAFLDTCARVFPQAGALQREARARGLLLHHAPVFGVVLRALEVALVDAQTLFLSLGVRAVLSSGVRLGIVGTHGAQRMLNELGPELTRVVNRCGPLPAEALVQTAPVLDLLGATHDRLYSRLFHT